MSITKRRPIHPNYVQLLKGEVSGEMPQDFQALISQDEWKRLLNNPLERIDLVLTPQRIREAIPSPHYEPGDIPLETQVETAILYLRAKRLADAYKEKGPKGGKPKDAALELLWKLERVGMLSVVSPSLAKFLKTDVPLFALSLVAGAIATAGIHSVFTFPSIEDGLGSIFLPLILTILCAVGFLFFFGKLELLWLEWLTNGMAYDRYSRNRS